MRIASYARRLSHPDFEIEPLISDVAGNFHEKKTVKISKMDFCDNLIGFSKNRMKDINEETTSESAGEFKKTE